MLSLRYGILLVFAFPALTFGKAVDWAQPPVGCIEEVAPKDVANRSAKLGEIYAAARPFDMPAQILYGALVAESALKDLGISDDGGNFSCGIGQVNIREWCGWANTLEPKGRERIGWPAVNIPCDEASMPTSLFAPFFAIARTRAPTIPAEGRGPQHYANIDFETVREALTAARAPEVTDGTESPPVIIVTPELVRARFEAATSFASFCQETRSNIRAKADALNHLFTEAVPAPLQRAERYRAGEKFMRACLHPASSAYPLHTGWLMAVGMYNAGKKFLPRIAYYYSMTKAEVDTDAAWADFNPQKLVEGLYGGGYYNSETGEINYTDLDGKPIEATWFKACIAQKHVANVSRYSVLPGYDVVHPLNRKGCTQKVPEERRVTSGRAP